MLHIITSNLSKDMEAAAGGGGGGPHLRHSMITFPSSTAIHPPFRSSIASSLHLSPIQSRSHLTIASVSSSSSPSVLPSPVQFHPLVLTSSINASFNLVALCSFVIFMQKSGNLPSNTASVLSQVSFNLVIPCFLMSKVCATISSHCDWSVFSFPLIAVVQIMVGGILGRLSCLFLFREDYNANKSKDKSTVIKEALLTVSCAFGNSVTIPLVFLNGMLSQTDYGRAAGYLALQLIGWSPCLWTLGYQIISSTTTSASTCENAKSASWWKKLMNPPLYGVLFGVLIGATPLSNIFFSAKHAALNVSSNRMETMFSLSSFMAFILQPILEAAKLLGSAAVPLQAIILASTLATSSNQETNGIEDKQSNGTTIINANDINLEGKAFWVITVVRLLVMPLINLGLITVIPRKWLPADPISRLTTLVISAMPTAQNLVVLTQLHSDTRPFAGALAKVLVKQYAISIVTITVWMPIFFSYLSIS